MASCIFTFIIHTLTPPASSIILVQGVTGRSAFQWQSQLKQRYVDGRAQLAIADARFNYGFEYLGNGEREGCGVGCRMEWGGVGWG